MQARQVVLTSTGPVGLGDEVGVVLPTRGELATDGRERKSKA